MKVCRGFMNGTKAVVYEVVEAGACGWDGEPMKRGKYCGIAMYDEDTGQWSGRRGEKPGDLFRAEAVIAWLDEVDRQALIRCGEVSGEFNIVRSFLRGMDVQVDDFGYGCPLQKREHQTQSGVSVMTGWNVTLDKENVLKVFTELGVIEGSDDDDNKDGE
jgi:hypothetical protein